MTKSMWVWVWVARYGEAQQLRRAGVLLAGGGGRAPAAGEPISTARMPATL